jgi:hypothetical protein
MSIKKNPLRADLRVNHLSTPKTALPRLILLAVLPDPFIGCSLMRRTLE